MLIRINIKKYAIYAYTHDPVTGQIDSTQLTSDRCRQSASVQQAVVERTDGLYVAKGPSSSIPPPLFSQCEAHGPPIGVGRKKKI